MSYLKEENLGEREGAKSFPYFPPRLQGFMGFGEGNDPLHTAQGRMAP
jgi:hypothetical protein